MNTGNSSYQHLYQVYFYYSKSKYWYNTRLNVIFVSSFYQYTSNGPFLFNNIYTKSTFNKGAPRTSMGKKILIPLVIGQKISALKPPKIKKNVF